MRRRSSTIPEFLAAFKAKAAAVEKRPLLDPRSYLAYGLVLLMLVVEGLLIAFASFTLSNPTLRLSFVWSIWMLLSAMLGRKYGLGKPAMFIEAIFLPVAIGSLASAATFMTTALAGSFADDMLIRADRALGFDWLELWQFYRRLPGLTEASANIYNTFFVQLWLIPLCLIAAGRTDRVWSFITAWAIAGLATAAIHPFFPAEGPYLRYGVMHDIMPQYIPSPSGNYLWDVGAKIDAIRSGGLRDMSSAMSGLVSVPSFHAASAVMFAWAAIGLRWLRLPFVLLNIAMWLASLISGSHYLIDLIAGTAVGAAAILAAKRIVSSSSGKPFK